MTGVALANKKIAEAQKLLDSKEFVVGSDLSVLIDKIIEWAKTLDLGPFGKEGVHAMLHFVTEVLIPRLMESTPVYVDLIITSILIPILQKIDEAYFHPTT